MKFWGKILWLFLILAFSGTNLKAQEEFFDVARKYAREGKYQLALDTYDLIAQKNPGTVIAHRARLEAANLLLARGDTSRATLILSELTKEDLVDSIANIVYLKLKDLSKTPLERGRILLDFAIKYPSSGKREEFLREAGLNFIKAGAYDKALRPFKILASDYTEKREEAQVKLGLIHKNLGQRGRAELLLKRYPENVEAKYYLVKLYLEEGDTALALLTLSGVRHKILRKLKYKILLGLGDPGKVLDELKDETSPEFADIKAEALIKSGQAYLLNDLLNEVKDTILLARAYLDLGEPTTALSYLRGLKSKEARYLRAEAYLEVNGYFSAYSDLIALPDDPLYNQSKVKLALALKDAGLYRDALELLSGLKHYYPKDELTQLEYELLLLRGDTASAMDLKEELLTHGIYPLPPVSKEDLLNVYRDDFGRPPSYLLRDLFRLGAYEEAVKAAGNRKLTLSEAEIVARSLVRLFRATGDTAYAEKAEKLFMQMPRKPQSYLELHAHWQPQNARIEGIDAAELDSLSAYYLALILARKGQVESAMETLRRYGGRLLERGLFEIYLSRGLLDSAYSYLDEKNALQVYKLASAYMKRGDRDIARELLDYIPSAGYTLDRKASLLRIKCLSALGNWSELKEAALQYLEVYSGAPDIPEVKKILALAYLETGEPGRALTTLYPFDSPEIRNMKARAYIALGRPELALDVSPPDSEILWEASFLAGDTLSFGSYFPHTKRNIERILDYYSGKGDVEKVRKLTTFYLGKGKIDADAKNYYVARALLRAGRSEEAKKIVDLLTDYYKARLNYEQGLKLFKEGKLEKAKTHFFTGIQWGDAELRGRSAFKLATVYFSERRYREAAEYYKMAFSLLKDSLLLRNALYNAAVSYKNLGEADSAVAYYKKVAELFSDTEDALDALFSLAYFLEEKGESEKALNYFLDLEGELRKPQDEIELLYWLGETYMKLKKPGEALQCFRRIYLFHPDAENWAVTAKLEAARAFISMGQKGKARTLLENVVRERGETDEFGKAALQQLRALTP